MQKARRQRFISRRNQHTQPGAAGTPLDAVAALPAAARGAGPLRDAAAALPAAARGAGTRRDAAAAVQRERAAQERGAAVQTREAQRNAAQEAAAHRPPPQVRLNSFAAPDAADRCTVRTRTMENAAAYTMLVLCGNAKPTADQVKAVVVAA